MKSRFLRVVAVAMFVLPFLIASCSKKDKGTGPTPGAAPTLIAPTFTQAVTFAGSNANIDSAKAKVQLELALVSPFLATPAAFATAANTGAWGTKVDSCWSKSSTSGTCSTAYQVCDVGSSSYEWTKTLDGTCSGTAHSQFVAVDATIKGDGSGGSFGLFASNTTNLDTLWKWASPSDTAKDWNVYKGAESAANLIANLHWKKGTGSSANNWTFTMAGTATALAAGVTTTDPAKWELHVSTDAKTGTMDVYQWQAAPSPGAYFRSDHIAWNPDTTGTWQVYNNLGHLTNEFKWPFVPAPTLTVFSSFSQTVNLVGSNAGIDSARAKVQRELATVGPFLATPSAFATAANTGAWGNQVGLCWAKSSTQGSCTTAYEVCDVGSASYDWTKTLDGTCSGTAHTQFKAVDAAISSNGSGGTFGLYRDNTTDLDTTWQWTTSADTAKNWNVYNGAVSSANLIATLHWSKGSGNSANNWTFEKAATSSALAAGASITDPTKWQLHVSADTKTGSMDIYQSATFWRSDHIAWNPDSTGTWQVYNSVGTLINETKWPITLPSIVVPDTGHAVVITSTDPTAQAALGFVQGMIDGARGFAGYGADFLGNLISDSLGNQVDGCWTWGGGTGTGCTVEWKLCQVAEGFHWTYTLDGSCGAVYNHFLAYEATFSADGRTGSFTYYTPNTTTPLISWAWSTAADGKSGTWAYYNGAVAPANLYYQGSWQDNADGSSDATEEILVGHIKWESHVSADGKSGFLKTFSWDDASSTYWLGSEIIWNSDGSGSWIYYNQDGTTLNETDWTA